MSRIVIVILIYRRHKPVDGIACWARSRAVMSFLLGTNKPINLINVSLY
jgi:hypothetical protein